jgi:hypothetical protein
MEIKSAELPGFSAYTIYSNAMVIRKATGKTMKTHDDSKDGYLKLKLTNDGHKRVHLWMTRLVYVAFNGSIPEKMEVDHLDGDRLNNRLENLILVTHRQNQILMVIRIIRPLLFVFYSASG